MSSLLLSLFFLVAAIVFVVAANGGGAAVRGDVGVGVGVAFTRCVSGVFFLIPF